MMNNMDTPTAVNRLLHEITKSLPYWESKKPEWDALEDYEKEEHLLYSVMEDDEEVRDAIINLIQSIRDDQTTSTSQHHTFTKHA